MKKRLGTLIGGILMILGCICYVRPIFARSYSEAVDACKAAGGTHTGTIPCAYVKCKVGGVERQYEYQCSSSSESSSPSSSSSSSSSSNTSSSSVTEIINRKREECVSKGGTFEVKSISGGYVNSTCTVNGQTENTSEDAKNSGNGVDTSSGGSDSPSSGDYGSNVNGSGTTWATDNSQAKSDNGCNGDGVKTNLFGDGCVSGTDGIFAVLNVILNVLTWGVGIAGTLGIVITGITYMTAKDDVSQMTKAKNRLIQIIIGLAVYAVMWGFLQWLLPGGVFGN